MLPGQCQSMPFCIFQKFFQKWTARGNMKDRTSPLQHRTVWTMVAPKTSLNSLRQTWRTWRSITILERIQAATLHLEWWWTRKLSSFFLFLKAEGNYRIVVETLGDSGKRGFHLVLASFQKRQTWRTMMGDQGGGGGGGVLQRRRFNSVAYNRDTETVDTVWSSSFGITTLTGSDSHWWTVKSVCCVYVSVIWRGKKRKKLQLQSHWLHLMW